MAAVNLKGVFKSFGSTRVVHGVEPKDLNTPLRLTAAMAIYLRCHSLMYRLSGLGHVRCRIALRAARGSRRMIALTIASCSRTVSAAI